MDEAKFHRYHRMIQLEKKHHATGKLTKKEDSQLKTLHSEHGAGLFDDIKKFVAEFLFKKTIGKVGSAIAEDIKAKRGPARLRGRGLPEVPNIDSPPPSPPSSPHPDVGVPRAEEYHKRELTRAFYDRFNAHMSEDLYHFIPDLIDNLVDEHIINGMTEREMKTTIEGYLQAMGLPRAVRNEMIAFLVEGIREI
jgi:hypothetical protein